MIEQLNSLNMSLIVTAYTQEGIVIGADSCITTNFTQEGKEL